MIYLQSIDETNYITACALAPTPEQRPFVAPAAGILARAYGLRGQRAQAEAIYEDDVLVGLVLWHDMDEEPACYHLMELLIGAPYQRRGCARAALHIVLARLQKERKYPRVELCVARDNLAAIRLYTSLGFRDTGYVDPNAPDMLCMAFPLRERFSGRVTIRETAQEDLCNVQRLWASPEVMRYVGGFPEGLQVTMEHLREEWLPWALQKPGRCHYSVYAEGVGYCGESFYSVDETGLACVDIKLLPESRGKGIAEAALGHALEQAFSCGGARAAWVDPDPQNAKALTLYARLGFRAKPRPAHLTPYPNPYLELSRNAWEARREARV